MQIHLSLAQTDIDTSRVLIAFLDEFRLSIHHLFEYMDQFAFERYLYEVLIHLPLSNFLHVLVNAFVISPIVPATNVSDYQ
jgi:hypothetical protein